jgi:hypothetical protein
LVAIRAHKICALMHKRSFKTHANLDRICAFTEQKDCSGCGACLMAAVYR